MILIHLLATLSLLLPQSTDPFVQTLSTAPDALSVTLASKEGEAFVSFYKDGTWSNPEVLIVEDEQDPALLESNLVMVPTGTEKVRIESAEHIEVNAIDIDTAPISYEVAAIGSTNTPKILTRKQWGADESILVRTSSSAPQADTSTAGDNGGAKSDRVRECEAAQLNYPEEFTVRSKKVTEDDYSRTLRWPHTYSKKIDLIAVHHTAVKVAGDTRSGEERVRALYTYHANNRGWGDLGYHYLIDEEGQIYEGKAGGKYVVAGHAYCNNINTLGVALLGNFEEEQPTQDQLKALQWLLDDLAQEYAIDLSTDVTYHGKRMSRVVGHRDLVSTSCPGYFVYGAIAQIKKNAEEGNLYASVTLPRRATVATRSTSRSVQTTAAERRQQRLEERSTLSRSKEYLPRQVQRVLNSTASRLLLRKLRKGAEDTSVRDVSTIRASERAAARLVTRARSSSRSSTRSSAARVRSSSAVRIRLTRQETGASTCDAYSLPVIRSLYRGEVDCTVIDGKAAIINTVDIEDYLIGLAEEPDTEPYEKQRAFAIAARTYVAHYSFTQYRKFAGMPYDGDDSPARFQLYGGRRFEDHNPEWVKAVRSTEGVVLKKDGEIIRPPYFSSNDGRTRTPEEAGWGSFPHAEIFTSKEDPWCIGLTLRGHGVGMSGCGAKGQALEGKTGEEILAYYYPGAKLLSL